MAELRLEVLLEAARSGETVAAICRRFGISRQTFYVYRRHFEAEGAEGLVSRSRQPIHQPRRMPVEIEAEICRLRKDHPRWGARRIRAELVRRGLSPPAVSSVHQALVRNDLVLTSPPRGRPARQRFERAFPNDLWQIDASRHLLADESEAWVMDILDDHARFCLAARVHSGPTGGAAWETFEWAVARYGLPAQVLSDNGTCFTGRLLGGEVVFERRLANLGVSLVHSRPYHPQTLGKLERFHRTVKAWLADRARAEDLGSLQVLLDEFRAHYNEERPHQGIADATPAQRYLSSPAPRLATGAAEPRAVSPPGAILRRPNVNGTLGYRGKTIQVGAVWAGQRLRVVEIEGVVQIFFGEQLVRALVLDPNRYYHPIGKENRPVIREHRQGPRKKR